LRQVRWSPEQISGWLSEQGIKLSHERIYQMIWASNTQACTPRSGEAFEGFVIVQTSPGRGPSASLHRLGRRDNCVAQFAFSDCLKRVLGDRVCDDEVRAAERSRACF
jgi:hypothetical protein